MMEPELDIAKELAASSYARGLVHGFTAAKGKQPTQRELQILQKMEKVFIENYERIANDSDIQEEP